MKKTLLTVCLATCLVSLPVVAAAEERASDAACTASADSDATTMTAWLAAENMQARLDALTPALTDNPWRALCLMASVATDQQYDLLSDVVDVLEQNGDANADVVAALMERYGDVIAQRLSRINTAGGGQPAGNIGETDFGVNNNTSLGENPGQLNTPGDDAPEAFS